MSKKHAKTCPACGDEIPPKGRTGPQKTYCSNRCRRSKYRAPDYKLRLNEAARRRDAEIRAKTVKTCPVCDETFTPIKSLAKMYCSKKCLRKATKLSKSQTCSVDGCSSPTANRGKCVAHYKREDRATGKLKDLPWDSPSRQRSYRIRLERLDGARNSDPVMLKKLIARGDKVCPECGEEIDLTIEYPHPMYRTIDHKKPLAKGGKHTLSNCQLMHAQCNASKGVRLSEKA